MKRVCLQNVFIITIILSLFCVPSAFASTAHRFQAQLDAGYFMGMSSDWADVYDSGGLEFGLDGSYRFTDWLRVFIDVRSMMADGEAVSSNDLPFVSAPETSFSLISGSIGLDYLTDVTEMIDIYAGLGVGWLMWSEEVSYDFGSETYDGSELGYLARFGGHYNFTDALALGLEFRYLLSEFEVDESAAELLGDTREFSGLTFALGFAYSF